MQGYDAACAASYAHMPVHTPKTFVIVAALIGKPVPRRLHMHNRPHQ